MGKKTEGKQPPSAPGPAGGREGGRERGREHSTFLGIEKCARRVSNQAAIHVSRQGGSDLLTRVQINTEMSKKLKGRLRDPAL